MRIGPIAATAMPVAGAAPLRAQWRERIVVEAGIRDGCEDTRRALRGTGLTPQDARTDVRDLESERRGRVQSGTFCYEDGDARFDGRTVVLSSDLCETAN